MKEKNNRKRFKDNSSMLKTVNSQSDKKLKRRKLKHRSYKQTIKDSSIMKKLKKRRKD